MKLYRILGKGWAGTQAEAKAMSREHSRPSHETNVPTDKPGLLAWLNERNVPATIGCGDHGGIPEPETDAPGGSLPEQAARVPTDAPEQAPTLDTKALRAVQANDLGAIADWIFAAEPWQIESVFQALGARFHEMRKAAQ